MQTWEAIRSRRNVRQFADRPIADDHLDEILEAGRRSPSSNNWQPWDFILVRKREQLQQLANVWRGAGHVAHSAATIALIAPVPADDGQRNRVQYDLGQATMSIMIAAAGLGIGSAHAGVGDQDMARSLLGFPEDKFCAYLIALGYPADRPLTLIRNPDRRPFNEVVHRDRWLSAPDRLPRFFLLSLWPTGTIRRSLRGSPVNRRPLPGGPLPGAIPSRPHPGKGAIRRRCFPRERYPCPQLPQSPQMGLMIAKRFFLT